MSQNRRSDDPHHNGSRRNKESEHESTTVSAPRSLEQEEEVLFSRVLQPVIERILEPLAPSLISQLEHGNLGSRTNNGGSEDVSSAVSALMKGIELKVMDTVQQLKNPVTERMAKEVIEAELEKILTRNSGIEMHSLTKSLELQIRGSICPLLWTGSPIEGEHDPLELELRDSETKQIVDSGPEASAEFEVFLLQGDLERNAVEECKGKNSLLKGNTNLKLNKGIGSLSGISFKHKSNWTKKCKLRLGARIVDPVIRMRVKEAKTKPFTLNDKRANFYEKHDCPSLFDPVWRLKNINRRGAFYKRLSEKSIETVGQFLTEFNSNPQGLQRILGSSMSAKMIEETVANAMKCELDDRIFHYSPSSQQAYCVFFNVVGQLLGVRSKCAYAPVDQLPETEKADAQAAVAYAFKHWEEVRCLDKNSLSLDSSYISNALCFSHLQRPESTSGHNIGNYHMINETDSTQPRNSLPDNPTFVGPNNGSFNMTDGCDGNWPHTNIIQPHSSDPGIIEDDISTQPRNSLPDNPTFVGPNNGSFNVTDGCDSNRPHTNIIQPHSSDPGIIEDDIFPQDNSFMGLMSNSLMGPFDSFEFLDFDFQMGSMCNSSMGPLDSSEFPNIDFQTLNVHLDYSADQGNNLGMETPTHQQSSECASLIVSAQAVAVGKVPNRWMRASAVLMVEIIKRSVKSNDRKRQRCS